MLVYPYLYESASIVTRNLFRSFVHASFLPSYGLQIAILFLSDVGFVALTLKCCRFHKNTIVFLLVLMYHVAFAIFDGYYSYKCHFGFAQDMSSFESHFTTVSLFGLVGIVVAICAVLMVAWLREFAREIRKFVCRPELSIFNVCNGILRRQQQRMGGIENSSNLQANLNKKAK